MLGIGSSALFAKRLLNGRNRYREHAAVLQLSEAVLGRVGSLFGRVPGYTE